jgi:hypothetical protein
MLAAAFSVAGLTCAGRGSISDSTGVDGVLGVKSCIKYKRAGKSLKSEQYDQLVWNEKRMLVDHRPPGGT